MASRDYAKRNARKNQEPSGGSAKAWIFAGILLGLFVVALVYLKTQGSHVLSAQMAEQTQEQEKKAGKPTSVPPPAKPKPPQPKFDFYNMLPQNQTSATNNAGNSKTVNQPSLASQVPEPTPASTSETTSSPDNTASQVTSPPKQAMPSNTEPQPAPTLSVAAETKHQLEQQIAQAAANESDTSTNKKFTATSAYILEIASFKNHAAADEFRAQLLLQGFMPRIRTAQNSNGETLYRIWLGPFANPAEAKSLKKQLKANKVHSLLVKQG